MVIYGRPDFTIGKDVPAMGPFKNYKPNIVGPGSGKIKVGIYIATQIGQFVLKRPWAKGTLTGTAIGTGLGLVGETAKDAGTANYYQALYQRGKRSNRKRRYKNYRTRSGCCSNSCH